MSGNSGGRSAERTTVPDVRVPDAMVPDVEVRSYYNRPILKQSVWQWMIPAYMFAGGVAGVSSMLGAGAGFTGRRGLARRARLTALGSIGAGTVFLIADLGRPARFANMLRVVKPSSPMSVGSWILAGYGPAAGVAAAADVLGVMPAVGSAADVAAGLFGAGLSTYTGVLIANTAVPLWHESRHELPFLFAASAAASAGGIAAALTPDGFEAGPAVRLAVMGGLAELGVARSMEQRLAGLGLADPLRNGSAGRLAAASKTLVGVGVAVMRMRGRRQHAARLVGGALIATGAALTRFAVMEAGKASVADPKYVVGSQRRRLTVEAADGRA